MLTYRQRQICALREQLDHLILLMITMGSAAVGFAMVGFIVPVGGEIFATLAGSDIAALLVIHARASRLRRHIDELNFFA